MSQQIIQMQRSSLVRIFLLALLLARLARAEGPAGLALKAGDVVAFIGGADVSSAQQTSHLESLLTLGHPKVRFRNFGWEGDTVFTQPRDFAFPGLAEQMRRAGTTVIVAQFGRAEALAGKDPAFRPAYHSLLQKLRKVTSRLVLVAPPPFEKGGGLLPDLTSRNEILSEYARETADLAADLNLGFIDLYSSLQNPPARLTEDGLQLSAKGQGISAQAFSKEIGQGDDARWAGRVGEDGSWEKRSIEQLRQLIISKNRSWFNYWRPQNWAFLGGDRTEQPSSRDHRDPKVRWFPGEIQKFQDLMQNQERAISELALK
ncbi:MAG TPA: GDSL-type esterase/lipase family protein, partial [Verrucomicrobiae bacterium]|nr:GDSL-type esterase/lipase family protein [Verrucomicrobiae bacterium]